MTRWGWLLGIAVGLAAACGGDNKPAAKGTACDVDDDCPAGHTCGNDDVCVKRRAPDMPQRSNNITPQKVKREAETRVREGTERRDTAIEALDP